MLCSLIVIWHMTTNHPQSPQLRLNRPSLTSLFLRPYTIVALPLYRLLPVIVLYVHNILAHMRSLHRPMSVSHVSTESGPFVRKTSYKSFITRPTYKKSTRRFKRESSHWDGHSELGCDRPPPSAIDENDIRCRGWPFDSIHCNTAIIYSPIYRSTRRIET